MLDGAGQISPPLFALNFVHSVAPGIICIMQPLPQIETFILAGGRSTRMGQNKALLPLAGQPLVQHMIDLAWSIPTIVQLVGDPQSLLAYAAVSEDHFPGQGPLAGIHAALVASVAEQVLILAVDMPFLTPDFLRFLIAQAQAQSQTSEALVTVPRLADGWQPLCAVYHKEFLPYAERALQQGRNRIDSLYSEVSVQTISEETLHNHGFGSSLFRNLNTPEDWQAAQLEFDGREEQTAK